MNKANDNIDVEVIGCEFLDELRNLIDKYMYGGMYDANTIMANYIHVVMDRHLLAMQDLHLARLPPETREEILKMFSEKH